MALSFCFCFFLFIEHIDFDSVLVKRWLWQTLVLIVFDTAFKSLAQSIDKKAKGELGTLIQRYHSSKDRLVVILISELRVCLSVCVFFASYAVSIEFAYSLMNTPEK